jgi:formylglycine-generating enzyme required for sulfatase activity
MIQKLKVFLCYAQEDKAEVRNLYTRLNSESWIDVWLDYEKILPGQDSKAETIEAMRKAHVIIVCLSNLSVAKEGFHQEGIKIALRIFEEKPERTIFIIPLLFNECDIPVSLGFFQYHWAGNSSLDTHPKLLLSLEDRASKLGINMPAGSMMKINDSKDLDQYLFNKIIAAEVPYTFYIGKYPVTNAQYERFLNAPDFDDKALWTGFPKFNEDYIQIDQWGNEGWNWLQSKIKGLDIRPKPNYWDNTDFGIIKLNSPVVAITWYEANAYCNWLMKNWSIREESRANPGLQPQQIRLPLEMEWSTAAGGENPVDRYPWDKVGKATKDDKEIARHANVNENIGHTTAVSAYLRGASPYGVMDMGGNVWEWQANFYDEEHKRLALRGGAWNYYQYGARVSRRYTYLPDDELLSGVGFRVMFTI